MAAEHHSVFTTGHARAAGITAKQREHRLKSGEWVEIYRNVYRFAGVPATWKGNLLAACWAGGFRAVASCRSAAALYGLAGGRTDVVEITCPRWRRARHPRLIVRESLALDTCDVRVVDGIPVTSPERTLLDLAGVCRPLVVSMAFDKARELGLVSYQSVERTLKRLAKQGLPGVTPLRLVLSWRDPNARAPQSEMETKMLAVIERNGLPRPVPQYEIVVNGGLVARVDAAYPEARIAIEYQSFQEHTGGVALVRDSRRANKLRRIRWTTVTVTAPELRDGGAEFCAALRAELDRAA
jgi:transcriptional regulator with AbiEi antitoxin domain of type IV toxin-antitoxin system